MMFLPFHDDRHTFLSVIQICVYIYIPIKECLEVQIKQRSKAKSSKSYTLVIGVYYINHLMYLTKAQSLPLE